MKKKIIIASATVLFAVVNLFNMNLLQGNSVGDVSLDAIAIMAQAQPENGQNNGCPRGRWQTVYNTGTWWGCEGNDYVQYSGGGSFEYCTSTGDIKNDNTYYLETSRIHNHPNC